MNSKIFSILSILIMFLSSKLSLGDRSISNIESLANTGKGEAVVRFISDAGVSNDEDEDKKVPRVSANNWAPKVTSDFQRRRSAESCSDVNFSKRLGKVRNQDSLNWCVAEAMADLYSDNLQYKVSSFDLILKYYNSFPDGDNSMSTSDLGENESFTVLGSADPVKMGDIVSKFGVCPESAVSSVDYMQSLSIDENSCFGQDLADMSAKKQPGGSLWVKNLLQTIEKFKEIDISDSSQTCSVIGATKLAFPNLTTATIMKQVRSSRSKAELLSWLDSTACYGKREQADGKFYMESIPDEDYGSGGHAMLSRVDELLDKNKPIMFMFNANLALNLEGYHTALIVGREFRDGKCQYLVRNSFGPSYSPKDGRENISRGHFWITEQEFNEYAIKVGYIK